MKNLKKMYTARQLYTRGRQLVKMWQPEEQASVLVLSEFSWKAGLLNHIR